MIDDPALELIEYPGMGRVTILLNMKPSPSTTRRASGRLQWRSTSSRSTRRSTADDPAGNQHLRSWLTGLPGRADASSSYDPDAGRAIVESVGPISFTLLVPGPTYYEQAVAAQAMRAAVCIEVDVQEGDAPAVVAQYRAGDYQASYTSFPGRIYPQVFAGRHASTHPADDSKISDAELDDLVAQTDLNVDRGVRADLYRQIAQRAAEVLPSSSSATSRCLRVDKCGERSSGHPEQKESDAILA